MSTGKFKNQEEYLEWCQTCILKIYYANIAMNNKAIKEVVAEIADTLHITEGRRLID